MPDQRVYKAITSTMPEPCVAIMASGGICFFKGFSSLLGLHGREASWT